MNTLAERLKAALKGPPKITQRQLAEACGIKPPSVNDWLTGKTKSLEGSNLLAASKLLKVNPTWLADGVGPMRGNASDWPFPDIQKERFDALTANQKIEIQGAVRNMIAEFEENHQRQKSA